METSINNSWRNFMELESKKDYFIKLMDFLDEEYNCQKGAIFPAKSELFKAFNLCPLEEIVVVIIGQDPYPTLGFANGLCFSVNENIQSLPKSLKNIFIEIESDIGIVTPKSGNLERWAKQGVLLLNNVLSVVEGKPDSHSKIGWEQFTKAAVDYIGKEREGVVYFLWGNKAQEKALSIDGNRNLILKSVHPSPLSAYRGFFGCKHFSKANMYLKINGKNTINW